MSLAVTAHESGEIQVFDFQANKLTKTLSQAHKSGVSAALFVNSGLHLLTGGHDGSVRVWDLRTNRVVQEVRGGTAHKVKYEEAVMGLAVHPDMPFFASGGADSLVNLYELNLH
jgi:striatin 1/3/4